MASGKGAMTAYVPNVAQRVTYEQAIVEHKPAASVAVRACWLRLRLRPSCTAAAVESRAR
jgi:hypothetical protein